jgi:NitT/TauT family transport system substrate-binding protein
MPRRPLTLSVFALILAALAAVALAACGSSSSGSGGTSSGEGTSGGSGSITLGTQPWIGYGPLTAIAPEEDLFAKNGLENVSIVNFKSEADINTAFASKRLDAMSVGISQALNIAEAGIPIKIVLLEDISKTADAVLGRGGINSIPELKGKKVAVEQGGVDDMMLRYALAQNGMSINDIDVVPMTSSEAGTAIIAGQVDAAATYQPFIAEAESKGEDVKSIYTAGEKPGLISDMLIVREEVMEEDPQAVQALVNAWGEAVASYEKEPKEGKRLISEELGAPVEELESAFNGIEFFDMAANKKELNGAFPGLVGEIEEIMVEGGLLENEIDTSELVDPTFVNAAKE